MITADHYGATTQAIADAIDRSISHTEIVFVECLAEHTHEAIVAELSRECEGEAESDACHEFWGTDTDGNDWRVHVKGGQ